MPQTKQLDLESRDKSVSVRIAGRVYFPSQADTNLKGSSPPRLPHDDMQFGASRKHVPSERQKKESSPTEQVAIDLFETVWSSLPIAAKSAEDIRTSEEIVPLFQESFERLTTYAKQVRTLVEAICRYHVQAEFDERLDNQQQRDVQEAKIRDCMDVPMPAVLLGKELDIKTLAKQPETAFVQLRDSLRQNTASLVESFFLALQELVHKEVVGLIEWNSQNTSLCKFHFFRRLVTHVFDGQSVKEREEEYWRQAGGRTYHGRQKYTRTTTNWREIHEVVRYEQQLMKASSCRLDSPSVAMPTDIRRIANSIPSWLSPVLRVAVGDCFRERIIRRVDDEKKKRKSTETPSLRIERPVLYLDPAITIGEFVLLGWGRKEEEREKQRQAAYNTLAVAGALGTIGILLLVGSMLGRPGLVWYGWGMMAVSLVPFNFAVHRNIRLRGRHLTPASFLTVNTIALSSGLSLVAGASALLSRAWGPAIIMVLLTTVVIPAGLFALWRQWFGADLSASA
jgi:hypothetical protein